MHDVAHRFRRCLRDIERSKHNQAVDQSNSDLSDPSEVERRFRGRTSQLEANQIRGAASDFPSQVFDVFGAFCTRHYFGAQTMAKRISARSLLASPGAGTCAILGIATIRCSLAFTNHSKPPAAFFWKHLQAR
jgi:hypothetical protein